MPVSGDGLTGNDGIIDYRVTEDILSDSMAIIDSSQRIARRAINVSDPAVGACWAEAAESVPVTQADEPCDKEAFEQGASLEQNLIRMTA